MAEKKDICSKCQKGKVVVWKGPLGFCESCGIIESRKLFKMVKEGQPIDPPKEEPFDQENVFQFPFKPPENMQGVRNVEVIFSDARGDRRVIQINHEEKTLIATTILTNRKRDKAAMLCRPVMLADPEVLVQLDAIMRMAAVEDKDTTDTAKKFLANIST